MTENVWKFKAMDADDLMDEMASAFNDAYDIDATTERLLQAALRVLHDRTDLHPPWVLGSMVHQMSRTAREKARMDRLLGRKP